MREGRLWHESKAQSEEMKFKLEIKPAIPAENRHKIEGALTAMGYNVIGGGTYTNMSACDVIFSGPRQPRHQNADAGRGEYGTTQDHNTR